MRSRIRRGVVVPPRALWAGAIAGATSAALLVLATPAPAATAWLCRPGLADNPCTGDLSTTVRSASGPARVQHLRPARRPAVDCFYVYPTVTEQQGLNATLAVEPQETGVAGFQASQFSRACRIYAPMYRQMTGTGLTAALNDPRPFQIAYSGVRAAWREYLRRFNRGRGIVLIGHSQGTMMLTTLVRREIDPSARERRRIVSALLLGGNVRVRAGSDVGGDFRHVRACRAATQVGCVVAYSTFDRTPPENPVFGRADNSLSRIIRAPAGDGLAVLCTNPAALRGGAAPLTTIAGGGRNTPWAAYPGLYTGRCRSEGGTTWLDVDVSPTDPRAPLRFPASANPARGLHLFDVNIALGDLLGLVRRQARSWLAREGA
jgi:hypothetical protein